MFEFMSREEASVRTDLFKQLFSHATVAQAQLQALLLPSQAKHGSIRQSPIANALLPAGGARPLMQSDGSNLELVPHLPYSPGFGRSAVSSLARAQSLGSTASISTPYTNQHGAYGHNPSIQAGNHFSSPQHMQQQPYGMPPSLIVQEDSDSHIRYAVPGIRPPEGLHLHREVSNTSVESVEYTTAPISQVAHAHVHGRQDSFGSVGYENGGPIVVHTRQESTDTISTLPRMIGIQHPVTETSLMDVSITT
jgi:hypothetical protein